MAIERYREEAHKAAKKVVLPLTPEELKNFEELFLRIMKRWCKRFPGPNGDIYHDIAGADFKQCFPSQKLGDNILWNILTHIQRFEPDTPCHLIDPLVFQNFLSLAEKRKFDKIQRVINNTWPKHFFSKKCPLFVIWNQNGNHWVLIKLAPDLRSVTIYDSFNRRQDKSQVEKILKVIEVLITVARQLYEVIGPPPVPMVLDEDQQQIPRQDNNTDCGIFVVAYFYCLLRGEDFYFSQKHINSIRLGAMTSLASNMRFDLRVWVQYANMTENLTTENCKTRGNKRQRLV